MNQKKILESIRMGSYIAFLGLLSFLILSLPALFPDTGDYTVAQEGITVSTPTPSVSTTSRPLQPSSGLQLGNFLYGVIFIVIVFLLIFVLSNISLTRFQSKQAERTFKTKEDRLRFSRDQAATILRQALQTGMYSQGIIEAYIALDNALDGFRGAERPKHWTPKEYAISVSPPVFQPTVYQIVDIFYTVRYGMKEGTKEGVELFLKYLFKLFENEISGSEKEVMLNEFMSLDLRREVYQIPVKGDLTKPKGGVVR